MIINKGDIFQVTDTEGLFVSDYYVNTEKESWHFTCHSYQDEEFNQVHTSQVDKVFYQKDYPEYYL